ncbi:TonB-dependent receptor [Cochleicola gelatinilyticus]|uniref:TonB-dependent receptor n=1 Tax=Cochleicola gelatinilyticus TaxID=1763537 RepID=A0A167H1X4_9FLAO|nr:TonB-dependent receptor [Cochleicola gelatinilyticus]OAB78126.1 TonB-dependent receptor [Cochleicola gelatinilyticus]
MKFLILSTLLLFIGSSTIIAQSNLSGAITNTNNEPVIATVYISQLEKGTLSDLNGQYTISNIPQGKYTVIYSAMGYATISKQLFFTSENTTNVDDVIMTESAVEMEQVIISTPFHKLQSDNVMKVERRSVTELNKKGATTLMEGVTDIAGVETISTGIGIGKPVIRGLSANRVLVYTQGVRLENQQFGDEHGLGVNEAGVESVEVIKGPASLLYGSDALGGVLYLNPERFAVSGETHGDVRSTYFSNTRGTATTLGVRTSGTQLKFMARGAISSHSDYQTGADYKVTNTRFNEKDLKTGVRFQNKELKSTLRYNYNRSNIGIPEEIGEQSTSKDLLQPFQEIDNHILSWENTLFFETSSLTLKAGYIFNDRREFEEHHEHHEEEEEEEEEDHEDHDEHDEHMHGEEGPALQLKLNTITYDLTYHLPQLGKFETIVGIQGLYQTNDNFGEEILIPDATTQDIGVLATTHYHLEKIDLQAGVRFDSRKIESEAAREINAPDFIPAINRNFTSFNAAIGAKATLTEQLLARINLASGFRAPNLAELTSNGSHEGTNRFEIGDETLTNEQNFQTDISLEYRNEHFEFSANGFYNTINDYIFIAPTNEFIDDNMVFNYVQNDANLYGGELGMHIHPHPLDWLHYESSFETVTGKLGNNSYLPLIPANKLRNTLRVEFAKAGKLDNLYAFVTYENTFNKDEVGEFETRNNSYNLLSLGTGCSVDIGDAVFDIGINTTNLTDETYISHLSRLKPDGIFNTGRSVNAHLKVSL